MPMQRWLDKLFGRTPGYAPRKVSRWAQRAQLQVERLEHRYLPSVNTLASLVGFTGTSPQADLILDSSGTAFGTTFSGGTGNDGTVFAVQNGILTTVASFSGTDGANPQGSLVEDAKGDLFGTTTSGGAHGDGTVFEVSAGSGSITSLASFNGANGTNPMGRLAQDSNGNLFGITAAGGANNEGTVFELKATSGIITTIASFDGNNGSSPHGGVIEDSSGNLFGTAPLGGANGQGTVFEVIHGSSTITTLAAFSGPNGAGPYAGLVLDGSGNLFGTTGGGGSGAKVGTVFEVQQGSGTITTLASFNGTNGAFPVADLTLDSGGNLFGTTQLGGKFHDGTVFEVPQGSGTINAVASFNGANGASPFAGLVLDASGNLFGVASSGGAFHGGTVFEVPEGSGTISDLADFGLPNTGANPIAGLVRDSSGNLFGTTISGGASNDGTVFEVQKSSGAIAVLASFNGTNGLEATGDLIVDASGNLFGTTAQGGSSSSGTVFEVAQGSRTITTLASFSGGAGGAVPTAGLVEDGSGNLFGATYFGGSFGVGTLFEIIKGSGTITTLANFNADSGIHPEGLIADASGNLLFGTTSGGSSINGSVFEYQKGAGFGSVAFFTGANGTSPTSGLVMDASGNLFGITSVGGASGDGTIFEVSKNGFTITTLATFTGANGANPVERLVVDGSGNLFGAARQGGAFGDGVDFELRAGSSTITPLVNFNGSDGMDPESGVIEDASGNLFGTTRGGGKYEQGTVYDVPPRTPPVIATSTLAAWTANQAGYLQTIAVNGGVGPLSFNLTGGNLPPGLTLSNSGVLSGMPGAVGSFSFRGTVTDALGATGSADYKVIINPAVIITTTALANGTVNQPAYSQAINAIGGTGPLIYSTPDGLPSGLTLSGAGVLSGQPSAPGNYSFTVKAADTVGAFASHGYTIVISPAVTITTTSLPNDTAGTAYIQTLSTSGGTGALTFSALAGSVPPGLTLSSTGILFGNPTVAGSYTFSVTATDTVSASSSQTYTVVVNPGAAVKLAFGQQPMNTPTGVTLPPVTVQILDAYGNLVTSDNTDTVTLGIAGGPGTFTAASTTTAAVGNGVATFSNLTLAVPGSYTLNELVPTLYTGPNSTSFTVAPLQVVWSEGTASGFSLQFNAPFLVNSVTPVLYGQGFGATAPAPSVIVTTDPGNLSDTAAYVEGSLVLDSATNGITFVATNTAYEANKGAPQLPDGTYTVLVRASAGKDGFQAIHSGGGFLDGLGTGLAGSGDYTTTFVVNTSAAKDDMLWVPATADGPGQALSAPGNNQVGGGYPIYLSDSTGSVTSVNLTLNYDPALLTVISVTGAGFTLLGSSTPGQAVLQYSGPALPAGSQTPIGFLTASVPSGTTSSPTPYRAKDLLHLSGVSLNGRAIPVVTSDGLHVVAYVGDADGNGSYSSNDAVLITRVALQTDTGFTAYPLVDPVIVADTDGAGFIPADAPLQVNEAGIGFPTANLTIPPIPSGVVFQPIANNMVIVAHPLSVHANPAGAHAAAAVRYPASAVAPIPSVVFVVFPPAWLPAAAHAAAQPLLDFWFQALARSRGNVLDAARVGGNVRDTFDRVLSSQVRSSPAAMDNFDDLFEAVSEKSREGMEIVVTRMCSIPS